MSLHKTLAVLLILFVIIIAALNLSRPPAKTNASDLTINSILQAVNRERELRNLLTLNTNSPLGVAAQSKTDDMQARHYFAHVDPDGNYIWPKISAAGYTPYLQLGENLAIEFYDADGLIAAWMNSPTHRANLLNEGFKDQGMGLTFGDSGAGQYHSAIANTFGALVVKKAVAAPVAAPSTPPKTTAPAPKPAPKPVVPAPAPAPATTSLPAANTTTPPSQNGLSPISPRGEFAMGENISQQQNSSPTPPTVLPAPLVNSSPAVINQIPSTKTKPFMALVFGVLLFMILLADIQRITAPDWTAAGKKINNLAVLFIALVVIAMVYWL